MFRLRSFLFKPQNKLLNKSLVRHVRMTNTLCYFHYNDLCRFCYGSGHVECMDCKYESKDFIENEDKKLSEQFEFNIPRKNCRKGWVECPFCGGNGQSHQIF